jgi:hypothetical protein
MLHKVVYISGDKAVRKSTNQIIFETYLDRPPHASWPTGVGSSRQQGAILSRFSEY